MVHIRSTGVRGLRRDRHLPLRNPRTVVGQLVEVATTRALASTDQLPDTPAWVKRPAGTLYWTKISTLLAGYVLFAVGISLNFL